MTTTIVELGYPNSGSNGWGQPSCRCSGKWPLLSHYISRMSSIVNGRILHDVTCPFLEWSFEANQLDMGWALGPHTNSYREKFHLLYIGCWQWNQQFRQERCKHGYFCSENVFFGLVSMWLSVLNWTLEIRQILAFLHYLMFFYCRFSSYHLTDYLQGCRNKCLLCPLKKFALS